MIRSFLKARLKTLKATFRPDPEQGPQSRDAKPDAAPEDTSQWQPSGLIIDQQPDFVGPLKQLSSGPLINEHHAVVLVRSDEDGIKKDLGISLDKLRELVEPHFLETALFASAGFYENWSIAIATDNLLNSYNILLSDQEQKKWLDGQPILFAPVDMIPNSALPRGRERYSEAVSQLRDVLAVHVYTLAHLLGGAIAGSHGVTNAVAREKASQDIKPYLLPLDGVMRAKQLGPSKDKADWVDGFYTKLREEVGPAYIRSLYGEKPGANEKLKRGKVLVESGHALAEAATNSQMPKSLPEIRELFLQLELIVDLLLRADRLYREGQREARREFSKTGNAQQQPAPLSLHIKKAIMPGRVALRGETLPNVTDLAKLAFEYDVDPVSLFPSQRNWVYFIGACRTLGRLTRKGELGDWTPYDWWGLKGLQIMAPTVSMKTDISQFRTQMCDLARHPLVTELLNSGTCIVPDPLLSKQYEAFVANRSDSNSNDRH